MLVLGCSGPCVQFLMQRATVVGWVAIAVVVAVAVAGTGMAVRRRQRFDLVYYPLSIFFHPAWWIGAYEGDCGGTRLFGSAVFTGAILSYFAVTTISRSDARRRRSTLGLVCGVVAFAVVVVAVQFFAHSPRGGEWRACLERARR